MKIKHTKFIVIIMIAFIFIVACFYFSKNENAEKESILTEIEDSLFNFVDFLRVNSLQEGYTDINEDSSNLNLYWPSFLVTIQGYDLWINNLEYNDKIDESLDNQCSSDVELKANIDSIASFYAVKSDSVIISQEVFTDNIEGKTVIIRSTSNKKDVNFKLFVSVEETISQFLPLEEYGRDGMEEKESKLEIWNKVSSYRAVKDLGRYSFRIPDRDSISDIKQIKADLALGDTCLYYEAEGGGHDVNYIYKGKPAEHRINGLIIRIEKYEKKVLKDTKYISISFPEAC